MRIPCLAAIGLLSCAQLAAAQQPDSAARSRQRADSIAKAVADSIALMKELGAAAATPSSAAPATPAGGQPGPSNPRLLPDISAVGDLVGDLSPRGITQEDGSRFGVREVELAVQAVVDPYFRGDVFLGISDAEGLSIEQAYLTTTSLPHQLEARLGRFLMPFGKQNLTHRHDLHTIEYPWVIQRLLGPEGLKGTGVQGSRVFSPFGFYQELQVTAVDRVGDRADSLVADEAANHSLSGLGYSARLRNYVDLSQASNVELSFSAMTAKREQPLNGSWPRTVTVDPVTDLDRVNAALARQTTLGADFTFRWRPLQEGLYKSFILQGEVMRQVNERDPAFAYRGVTFPCPLVGCVQPAYAGPARDYTGAYAFARWQTSRRSFIGA
ncbi:MAG TPA: hypothetical protein VGE02_12175, partial [Gemmatimonadales bacterium]